MASTRATGGTGGGKDNGGGSKAGKDKSGRGKRVEKREYRRGKHNKCLFSGLFCTCVLMCEGKRFYFNSKDSILGVKMAMTKD
ncbi:hypothetical protein E2C01_029436 [Portunus trituberculatus]|uniref:Uncharacterized protein n=1 Tax=Portunus trituberculatus TaxID=210409 RepID=A0A5B7ERG2_PORTR|nr:hypothetical protein [Portunus trituberculatus]